MGRSLGFSLLGSKEYTEMKMAELGFQLKLSVWKDQTLRNGPKSAYTSFLTWLCIKQGDANKYTMINTKDTKIKKKKKL